MTATDGKMKEAPAQPFLRTVFCSSGGLIFAYVTLLVMCVGVVITLTPSLYVRVFAADLNHTTFEAAPHCGYSDTSAVCRDASAAAGSWSGYTQGGAALVTFLVAPLVGQMSDVYGRRAFLVAGCFLALIPYPALGLGIHLFHFHAQTVVTFTYAAVIFGGGVSNFNLAVALMWISDTFEEEHRAPAFALLLASVDVVLAATPILGVELGRHYVLLPWIVCSASFVATLMLAICIPESPRYRHLQNAAATASATSGRRNKKLTTAATSTTKYSALENVASAADDLSDQLLLDDNDGNSNMPSQAELWSPKSGERVLVARQKMDAFWSCKDSSAVNPFASFSILNRSSFFRRLAALSFFNGFVNSGIQSITFYIQLQAMHMTQTELSLILAVQATCGFLAQSLLVRPLIKCMGLRRLVQFGSFCMILMCLGVTTILFGISKGECTFPLGGQNGRSGDGSMADATFTTTLMRVSNGTAPTKVAHMIGHEDCVSDHAGASWTPYLSSSQAMWMYTITLSVFNSLSYVVFPGISALKTNNVAADEQGGTLGALWSTKAMANAISPFAFGALWRGFSTTAPWAVYALASGVAVIGFLVSLSVPEPTIRGGGGSAAGGQDQAKLARDVEQPSGSGQKTARSVSALYR
jgi:MFS family permease